MKKFLFLVICVTVCVFVCGYSGCDGSNSATVDYVQSNGSATRVTATEVSNNHYEVSTSSVSSNTRALEAAGRILVWVITSLAGGGR